MATFLDNIPQVTKHLIIINVIMFLATLINENFMVSTFALFYPASPFFHWWQWITHMFMHGGFWHILFNMYALFIFGTVLERALGSKRFAIFYFVCGLGAMLIHTGVEWIEASHYISNGLEASYIRLLRTPTLGASGAIYGVLMGFAMIYPNAILTLIFPPIPLKAKWWILIFAAIEIFTGVTGTADGVAHFAHLGGMIFGFILLTIWRRRGLFRHW